MDFAWIIGSDVLQELSNWKDVEQLQELVSFLVVPRAGFVDAITKFRNSENSFDNSRLLHQLSDRVHYLGEQEFQLPNISSTQIRERIKQKQPIHHLVSRKIEAYIYAHQLYQE